MIDKQTLDISWEAIGKVLAVSFLLVLLYLSREIVIWFFFALIISILFEPGIVFLTRLRLPKILATSLVYLSIFGALGLLLYLAAPTFLFELNQLAQNIPGYFEKFNPILKEFGFEVAKNFEDFTAGLAAGLKDSSGSIFKAVVTFFGGVYSTFMILTLAFYISLEKRGTETVLKLLLPKRYENQALVLFGRAQSKVAGWFGARIVACFLVGVVSFAMLFLLGVKYAFILALIAGVLNFVPYIGPLITVILSGVFVGASDSWLTAVYVVVVLFIIHEIEIKIFTPILMKKVIALPAVLVLIALLVGEHVFGFLGMIFAVPVFGIIYEFSREFLEKKKQEEVTYES